MASLEDVMDALADVVAADIYPQGSSQSSVTGDFVRIYPGWPSAVQLEEDLDADRAHVSIWPTNRDLNTTRYFDDRPIETIPAATLTGTFNASASEISFSGAVDIDHNVGVTGKAWQVSLRVSQGSTLNNVATDVAAGIVSVGGAATATASVVSVGETVAVSIGTIGTIRTSPRQQRRSLQLIVWSSTPDQRRRISDRLDQVIAKNPWLVLADGSKGRLVYESSPIMDRFEKANLFRRDFFVSVEFSTIVDETTSQITVTDRTLELCP